MSPEEEASGGASRSSPAAPPQGTGPAVVTPRLSMGPLIHPFPENPIMSSVCSSEGQMFDEITSEVSAVSILSQPGHRLDHSGGSKYRFLLLKKKCFTKMQLRHL